MAKKEPKWTHPIHARGVRSPRFDVRGGKLLTDKQIHKYALEGRYGTDIQADAMGKPRKRKGESQADKALRLLKKLMFK